MTLNKLLAFLFVVVFCAASANAQKAEITISLNEQFFDALLDGLYQSAAPPEFPIAQEKNSPTAPVMISAAYAAKPLCPETIKLLRESNGLRTSVRFRDGKIYATLAFTGNYNPPFIGCVAFSGYAETNINLEFDQAGQRLIARANVLNVSLNGTAGVGGTLIAKMVQSSIDKKINPIEIIRMDKVSFLVPVQNSGNMRMKATNIRSEILNGALNIYVEYEFLKG